MSQSVLLCLCLLAAFLPLSVVAKPAGGVAKFTNLRLDPSKQTDGKVPASVRVCKEIGFYNESTVRVSINYRLVKGDGVKDDDAKIPFRAQVILYKAYCANTIGDEEPEEGCTANLYALASVDAVAENTSPKVTAEVHSDSITRLFLDESTAVYGELDKTPPTTTASTAEAPSANVTNSTEAPPSEGGQRRKRDIEAREDGNKQKAQPSPTLPSQPSPTLRIAAGSGMYIVQVIVRANNTPVKNVSQLLVNVSLNMLNPHGYLSAVDYPALVFYGIMTAVYAIYAFAWLVMMGCAYKDLVRLQFWVLAVILLGFLEKILFVSEYGSINTGNEFSGLIMVAEFVSAVKRALSRMLLIIVAMGFGTVKPRLGDSLGKVVAVGIIYTILAVLDGIIRARNETFVSRDAASTVTLALLLIFDSFIMYWIFTSIVDTRRTLRLRKNYVKLAMYNHFAYTLIFAVVASLGFIVWALVTLNFPAGNCLSDWKEVWLRECFWHILFAFIVLIVMIIWRPSANRNRFAYSLVNDEDDIEEDEPEQGPNKNFDTLKMRQMTKSESDMPPVVTQAEDDLRWVEENLPTTAMDKALPLILDSDEEVMTTKFEISKMN